jgi:hypothetical protein
MGRLIPGPYSTNKNLTGTCAENLTDTFSYSSRAGSADNGPYVDVFRQLYNPKLNPRYNGKQFSSGTLHRAAGGVALRNTGAGLAGTCTQDNLRGPFIRGCASAAKAAPAPAPAAPPTPALSRSASTTRPHTFCNRSLVRRFEGDGYSGSGRPNLQCVIPPASPILLSTVDRQCHGRLRDRAMAWNSAWRSHRGGSVLTCTYRL